MRALSLAALVLSVSTHVTSEEAPLFTTGTFGVNYTAAAAALRSVLLDGYDKRVPPMSDRRAHNVSFASSGTDVYLNVRFFKVQQIQPASGSMRLKVWVRMSWYDNRLRWDPADYDGIDYVFMWADPRPTSDNSEIWLPDVQPYNAYHAMADTLDPVMLRVHSDGLVFFSRPGTLEIMCKFSGLVAFPFDTLKCQIEFGGWLMSAGHQGILLGDGGSASPGDGYFFAEQEATSGTSYQEFTIGAVSSERVNYVYPCCPNEPWPVALYTVSLDRANNFYSVVIIMPTMIITVLSFAVFFLPPESADALGYGITIIVVVILMQVVMIDFLPICAELLWINYFILSNTFFCMLALFQSCVTIVIDNLEGSAYPAILSALGGTLGSLGSLLGRRGSTDDDDDDDRAHGRGHRPRTTSSRLSSGAIESVAGVIYRELSASQEEDHAKQDSGSFTALRRGSRAGGEEDAPAAATHPACGTTGGGVAGAATPQHTLRPGLREDPSRMSDGDRLRLVFFENLFFKLDENRSGNVTREQVDVLLSFAALDMDGASRIRARDSADVVRDGVLSRTEFLNMCIQELWNVPFAQLDLAFENVQYAHKALEARRREDRKKLSNSIDKWSSFLVPVAYFMSQIVLFYIVLDDDYLTDPAAKADGSAIRVTEFEGQGIAFLLIYTLALLLCAWAYFLMKRAARKREEQRKLEESEIIKRLEARLANEMKKHVTKERLSRASGRAAMLGSWTARGRVAPHDQSSVRSAAEEDSWRAEPMSPAGQAGGESHSRLASTSLQGAAA